MRIGRESCRAGRVASCASGFTLVEMLVAMTIMLVIMLMMATIFHQSNVAWTTGFREVDMSMQGRAVLNLISEELSDAVSDQRLHCSFGPSSMTFLTQGRATATNRAIYAVSYARSGTSLDRTSWETGVGAGYPKYQNEQKAQVVDYVMDFEINVPGGDYASYTTNLPPWVELRLVLEKKDAAGALIQVASAGRDKQFDSKDDVRSWKEEGE